MENLNFNLPFITYSWYVPVDADHYRWFTFLAAPGLKGPRRCGMCSLRTTAPLGNFAS